MNNCRNITKPKTRVYNHLAKLDLLKELPQTISDQTVFFPRHFLLNNKKRYLYTDAEGNLVFDPGKKTPLSWETVVNRELVDSVSKIYGMVLPADTKIVEFIYPAEGKTKYIDPYVKFNEDILTRIEKFAYEYPQELVPPQMEESNKLEPDDFTEAESPSPSISPTLKIDEKGQYKMFQEAGTAEALSALSTNSELAKDLQRTTDYTLLTDQEESDVLNKKSGQAYVFLKEKDAERLSFLLEKHKEYPKEFTVTQRVEKFERTKGKGLSFKSYNEYRDFVYLKSNKNKKSNLYNIIDKGTGELVAEKVRIVHLVKDAKETIAARYGLEFTPTQVFSADRSIAFALYRQKPSKAKYVAQAKRYLYDAIKLLNPQETALKINLDQVEELLNAFPSGMWDYINTTYSPEDRTKINASISIQNQIKFKLPKLGLLTELEKTTGKKLQGTSFKNYDRSGGIEKVLKVEWGEPVVIDYKTMTTKQLRKAIAYYLNSTGYLKPTSEEENVRKYAEHRNIDYNELKKLVFGDFDEALENIAYNQTGNSDEIELSKWRESIRNYDWQMVELFSKPYENFYKRAQEKVKEKFKDKELSNGISHLDYFFTGSFNWLNINFNNISGQYYESDMETPANVGVQEEVKGYTNPFVMKTYTKPVPGKNFLKEEEVFNRLASILHEPFHALHALSYGTKEELALRRAFDNLYNTAFGKEMMNQVFGSGYRGEEVSYDVLYKEFTAFATQLMLFPKEWITRTDLRSNDIYEFIEKVQTLQDKTYEEIVRTAQKIGTTEKIVTEEEKIKLSFLENLYNFVVSALNKVIPLSKKFFKTIADSRLVEKTVIEDVFGEVEEKVTRVVKLPKEVKESKEEFLSKMDDLKSAILTLMQIDQTMFSSKNINNFFTKPSFYQESGTVKPGVAELFESNPELADEVYRALGFTEKKYADKLKGIAQRRSLATKEDLEKSQLIKDLVVNEFQPNELKPNKSDKNLAAIMLYGERYDDLSDTRTSEEDFENSSDYKKSQSELLAYRILNNLMFDVEELAYYEDIIKQYPEYASTLSTNENPVKDFFENDIFEQAEKEKFEITPQQKQQAQQLYSQYLDTIFPDSKVKDIVYHGTKTKDEFEKFITEREYPIQLPQFKGKISKGSFFTKDKSIADVAGIRTITAILNMENPLYRNKGSEYLFKEDVEDIQKNNDSLIAPGNKEEFIVFEPEQIHILGNQEDIEGFKEFVEQTSTTQPTVSDVSSISSFKPRYEMTAEEREQRFQDFYNENQNISEEEAREYFNRCMI